jgi:AraC-like DNA-binding protein
MNVSADNRLRSAAPRVYGAVMGRPGPAEIGASDRSPLRPSQGAYGHPLAASFHLDTAPTLVSTLLKTAQLAVTRLASAGTGTALTLPIPVEKACLVSVALRDIADAEFWRAGTLDYRGALPEGAVSAVHLEDEPSFRLPAAFDLLALYIPELAFDELAADFGIPRVNELAIATGTVDPVIQQLGLALLPALEARDRDSRLFFDHIALALCAHLATHYGRLAPRTPWTVSPLSPWQERLAKELLAADLTAEPSVAEIARACRLPPRRFLRAFRETTGMPPHRWLRTFRIERAKELLLQSSLSLAQIAYDCGFADQSHLTRTFAAAIGVTPGAWRRARRS